MNKVILVGRLTRDPETRYTQGENPTAIARYTLAVDRRFKREGQPDADFIRCVVFGKGAEFSDKYFKQGMRVAVSGRIQTGSYTNRDGVKVYTTEVIVEDQEFAQSKNEQTAVPQGSAPAQEAPAAVQGQSRDNAGEDPGEGFMNIPEGVDEDLPFN